MRYPVMLTTLEEDARAGVFGGSRRSLREDEEPIPGDVPEAPPAAEETPAACSACAGTGTSPTGEECPECHGTGKLGEAEEPPETDEPPPAAEGRRGVRREGKDALPGNTGVTKPTSTTTIDTTTETPPVTDTAEEPEKMKVAQEWLRGRLGNYLSRHPGNSAPRLAERTVRSAPRSARVESAPVARAPRTGDRLARLAADVQESVRGVRQAKKESTVKAFANIALIGHYLGEAFTTFGKELKETSLLRMGRKMSKLGEDAAMMATGLAHDGDEPEEVPEEDEPAVDTVATMTDDEIDTAAKDQASQAVDALDLYADLAGEPLKIPEDEEPPAAGPAPEEEEDEEPPAELPVVTAEAKRRIAERMKAKREAAARGPSSASRPSR